LWSDGRRQLDKHLKTIKQRPKVRIVQAENGVGRRVLLPVRVAYVVCVVVGGALLVAMLCGWLWPVVTFE